MEVNFEEFKSYCEHCDCEQCNIIIEGEALNQMDDPDFEADSVECSEANCPFNKINSPYGKAHNKCNS